MSKQQTKWQLLTVDQIAQHILKLEREGDTAAYRVQKSYYKSQHNQVMIDRFEQAEALLKSIKASIQLALEQREKQGLYNK